MGVINLGLLVDKIKRKLESSGFIKNTDYASASAAGVVKVGDGLAITDAGVLSATAQGGGVEPAVLYEGTGLNLKYTFPEGKSMTDYNFVVVLCSGDCHGTAIVPVSKIVDAGNTGEFVGVIATPTQYLIAKLTTTTLARHSGQSGVNIIGVYAF